MRSDFTLWLFRDKDAVLPGQVIEIGGITCQFIGIALNRDAYFWIEPGKARYMNNAEMAQFGLVVKSDGERGKLK